MEHDSSLLVSKLPADPPHGHAFSLSQPKDAQESPPPTDFDDMLNLEAISLSLPSLNFEDRLFDDGNHPFHHVPAINVDLVAKTHVNPHGSSYASSLATSTPVMPGFSPSHPGYSSSPNLSSLTPPTPARTVPDDILSYRLPAFASPYLGQVAPWQLSQLQAQPSPERERVIPFSEYQRGPMVPQKRYKPHTFSDRRRYVDEVVLEESVHFYMQKPDEVGIPLRDAMHGRFAYPVQRDEPMFQERGPSISVRINWPGYQPWSRQIPTRDFRNPPGPITRGKLAKNVAKSVARFIAEHKDRPVEADDDPAWALGPGKIDVFDLVLVRLDHVSKGSWQAQLQLLKPFT